MPFHPDPNLTRDDLAIDDTTALLYSNEAPLTPGPGLKDAHAVWSRVLPQTDRTALVYLHGHNNYVTVDATGKSRVPDWAAGDAAGKAGASGKPAAPLIYGFDRLETQDTGKRPVILVPEDATLATNSFWAHEPAGQYENPFRLSKLIDDCLTHLAQLPRPSGGGRPYLPFPPDAWKLNRTYLSGHSGAGLPLEQAATSALMISGRVPADLWLFDCTYWSKIDGFVEFCRQWNKAGRFGGGDTRASRFVCVYKPGTQTEAVANALRDAVAKVLDMSADSLVVNHVQGSYDSEVRPVLRKAAATFVRTYLPHDDIPGFFIPALLETAYS